MTFTKSENDCHQNGKRTPFKINGRESIFQCYKRMPHASRNAKPSNETLLTFDKVNRTCERKINRIICSLSIYKNKYLLCQAIIFSHSNEKANYKKNKKWFTIMPTISNELQDRIILSDRIAKQKCLLGR